MMRCIAGRSESRRFSNLKEKPAMKKYRVVTAIALTGLALTLAGCSGSPSEPERKAENGADVSDTVTIKYPASTIICSSRNDMSKVHAAGELAMRLSYRVDHSVKTALDSERSARESMMQSAYSCEWADRLGRDRRYVVSDKEIIGTEEDVFHVVEYCLLPVDSKTGTCWWIAQNYGHYSPVQQVRSETVARAN
jgi:hypothetical protein